MNHHIAETFIERTKFVNILSGYLPLLCHEIIATQIPRLVLFQKCRGPNPTYDIRSISEISDFKPLGARRQWNRDRCLPRKAPRSWLSGSSALLARSHAAVRCRAPLHSLSSYSLDHPSHHCLWWRRVSAGNFPDAVDGFYPVLARYRWMQAPSPTGVRAACRGDWHRTDDKLGLGLSRTSRGANTRRAWGSVTILYTTVQLCLAQARASGDFGIWWRLRHLPARVGGSRVAGTFLSEVYYCRERSHS